MTHSTSNRKVFKQNGVNTTEQEVISISVEILREISTFVSIGVKLILAAYFLSKYSQKKMEAPLVWGAGFFFFGLSQVPVVAMQYFRDPAIDMAFALLAALLAALSLALLYYGASLLYFVRGSFWRERFSIFLFVGMAGAIGIFFFAVGSENVLKSIFLLVATGFIFPILAVVALLFFIVWRKLEPVNPRRINVLFVAFAWLGYSLVNGFGSFFFTTSIDWIFYMLSIVSSIILLYGMTLGKATGH